MIRRPPRSPLFPYTPLSRSQLRPPPAQGPARRPQPPPRRAAAVRAGVPRAEHGGRPTAPRRPRDGGQIGRAHVRNPVTATNRMPASPFEKKKQSNGTDDLSP